MPLSITPRRLFRALFAVALALTALHLLGQWLAFFALAPGSKALRLAALFDLNGEGNVPAWWAAATLLGCAGLLAVTAALKRSERDRWARHWGFLSLLLAYLSLDETAQLHEHVGLSLRSRIGPGVPFYHVAWVLPALAAVGLVGLSLLGFLRHLPAHARRLWTLSGAVFVGSSVGLEMAAGALAQRRGTWDSFGGALINGAEEFGEMLGVALFAYAALAYLREYARGQIHVRLAADDAAPGASAAAPPEGALPAGLVGGERLS